MKKNATPKITMDSVRDPLENYKDVMDDYLGITNDLGIGEDESASQKTPKRHPQKDSPQATRAIRVSKNSHMTILQIQIAYALNNQKVSAATIIENCLKNSITSLPEEVLQKFKSLKRIYELE